MLLICHHNVKYRIKESMSKRESQVLQTKRHNAGRQYDMDPCHCTQGHGNMHTLPNTQDKYQQKRVHSSSREKVRTGVCSAMDLSPTPQLCSSPGRSSPCSELLSEQAVAYASMPCSYACQDACSGACSALHSAINSAWRTKASALFPHVCKNRHTSKVRPPSCKL